MRNRIVQSLLLVIVSLNSLWAQAPKEIGKAVTMDGRRILLYDNGTFRYELAEMKQGPGTKISTDTVASLFESKMGTLIQSSPYNKKEWRSSRTNFAFEYNPKKWKLNLRNKTAMEEASMMMADTYASFSTERVETDYETWMQSTKLRVKEMDPQGTLVKEEWRTVNGLPLYHMVWVLNVNRVKFKMYGYYAIGKGEIAGMQISTPLSVANDTEEEVYRALSGLKIVTN
jgi:hypothetical protein